MPATTRSTPPPDPILQTINDRLLMITQDITNLRQDVTDLKNHVTTFQQDFPHKIETLDTRITVIEQDMSHRIDTLTLKTADVAVELSEFQQSFQDRLDSIIDDPMTFTPTIISSVDTILTTKLQELPQLIQHELLNSPTIRQLQSQPSSSHNPSVINDIIDRSPTITTLLRTVQELQHHPRSTPSIPRITGFHQPESKDFHVSRLLKLLDTVTLASDSLQDLETFHDTIRSHFATVSISSNIFPNYKNLQPSFTFHEHLCSPVINHSLSSSDIQQALLNYTTFGSGLRQFILNPKTISQTTSPDSYLQLLSLRHENDGFLLYQNFIFLRSPQLEGKFIDYRVEINKLSIIDGESLRSFYARVIWLFNELQLAQLQDGSTAALLEHFLDLLRSTGCHIILAETSTSWKEIRAHRRLPNHMSQPLPWTLNQILRDLETAKVTTLHVNSTSSLPSSIYPTALLSTTPTLPVPEAYAIMNSRHHHQRPTPSSKHNNNNYINNNRPPPSASTNKTNKCLLCNNQHPNPWHSTDQCPFKDPTYIQNKLIRDNVMQHNTLYGKINKNFIKTSDSPTTITNTTQHPQRNLAKLADLNLPTLDPEPVLTTSTTSPSPPYHNIQDTSFNEDPHEDDIQCIDTQYFDVPTPAAHFSSSTIPSPSTTVEPIDNTDILFDPLQYLHFSS
jgi:hypothetical protein